VHRYHHHLLLQLLLLHNLVLLLNHLHLHLLLLFNRLSYKSKLESLHKKTMVTGRKMFISQLFSTESLLIQMFLSQRSCHCLGSVQLIFSHDPHDLFPASLEPFLVQQRSASSNFTLGKIKSQLGRYPTF
jgi:hypothetical protein